MAALFINQAKPEPPMTASSPALSSLAASTEFVNTRITLAPESFVVLSSLALKLLAIEGSVESIYNSSNRCVFYESYTFLNSYAISIFLSFSS